MIYWLLLLFQDDPVGIQEISEDVRSEGEKCGKVNKVIVFDVSFINFS
jgi:hypothetical protein